MSRNVLVTGGAGFIGSHVVDKLMDAGYPVFVYDLAVARRKTRDDATYLSGSILDLEELRLAMTGIDVVYHLAAVADVKDVAKDPYYAEAINTRGTVNVLEAARRSNVSRVVLGSTTWVYSDVADEHVDEDTPLPSPAHFYTATKLAAEYYCQSYQRMYGVDVTILRYGIPYGPRARDGAVLPIFVKRALEGLPLTIAGDGSQYRKFVYVEDLAEGNVAAMRPEARNRIYNLEGTERVSIREMAETIQRLLGNVKIEYIDPRPGDFGGKEVSNLRAKVELGWEPRVSFEEGVRRYIDWYRQRR